MRIHIHKSCRFASVRQIFRAVTNICIFRDGRNCGILFAVVFIRCTGGIIDRESLPSLSEARQVPLIFFPSNECSTSLVAVTVCRGFSVGRLSSARSRVDPRCFRERIFVDWPHTLNALRGVCTRGIHCGPSRWISVYANTGARKALEREVQYLVRAVPRRKLQLNISVYNNIFRVFAKCMP